jgi:exonuclease III
MAFSFVTININGLIEGEKRRTFLSWLIKKKFDSISLQETQGTVSDIEKCGGRGGKIWVEALVYGATGRGHRVELRSF